ncbi:MAG: DUF5666 domain-containing protein [Edaphobacter sp.]|uniref:DUF5666 domain-containing protein n=1 Tax=Edaphobacter sp. TaxID=1934404 RepID=UPI0023A2E64C|nr:DUF5666 domain-containing protein [Edaphobacter sp.]MDE1177786.1 DUF5666 domain-containing protein [Edaphobacter sp.]
MPRRNEADKADWQHRGAGGIVSAVSGTTVTISSGAKKIAVDTNGTTKFRRYGADSVKFEDTKPGTLDQIQAGDQLRVRGTKSEDGMTITAEEIVSGSFKNLAGTLTSVNASAGTVTLKDLATKKTVTVAVTSNSDLRRLPPEMATRLVARSRGAAAGGAGNGGAPAGGAAQPHAPAGTPSQQPGNAGGTGRAAGGDLSQMLAHLPTETVADLKAGEAVMIVASNTGDSALTAVTLLTGVEPILAASPSGSPEMTLAPWNMGGGGAEAGGPQ